MRTNLSMNTTIEQKAIQIIKRHKGVIRTNTAIKKHIHPRTLYSLRIKECWKKFHTDFTN